MDAHHRLVWALFAGDPDRKRDFLWRSEGKGRFLILSPEVPSADGAGLFAPPEVKPFAPDLRAGDRLGFVLRANATRTRKLDPDRPAKRVDVVMDAIHHLPPGQHSDARREDCVELRFMAPASHEMDRAYKTPSLRGAAARPPYMHAGQIATLEAVIDHYSRAPAAPEGHTELEGVIFTDRGRAALIAFLKTLDPPSDP